jgi:hypothetical protein
MQVYLLSQQWVYHRRLQILEKKVMYAKLSIERERKEEFVCENGMSLVKLLSL